MKSNNIINLQKPLLIIQINVLVLPLILALTDFIADYKIDHPVEINEILINGYIIHTTITEIICQGIEAFIHVINNSTSIIEIRKFISINLIYTTIVNIICIHLIFYYIDNKKLTSLFSTLFIDTLFGCYKEVNKALINIP